MAEKIDLDAIPQLGQAGSGEEAERSKSSPQDQYSYLFVDYDLLRKDPHNGNRFWGNWRATAAQACSDKNVNSYVDRGSMRDYNFAQACPPSKNGIWRFSLA